MSCALRERNCCFTHPAVIDDCLAFESSVTCPHQQIPVDLISLMASSISTFLVMRSGKCFPIAHCSEKGDISVASLSWIHK